MTESMMKTFLLRLFIVSFSAFLVWQSIQLTQSIIDNVYPLSFRDIVIDSVLMNLFITGVFLVGYALPVHRLLPDSYYRISRAKSFSKVCRILKVEQYRGIIRFAFWRPRHNKKHFFNGTRSGLVLFEINTRISESGHLFAFLILLPLSLYIASAVDIRLAVSITLINVLFNFYPLILQRYHRLRLRNTMT